MDSVKSATSVSSLQYADCCQNKVYVKNCGPAGIFLSKNLEAPGEMIGHL